MFPTFSPRPPLSPCLVQGTGISFWLKSLNADAAQGVLLETGPMFTVLAVTSLTAGSVFLMWLGEQITQRGVGNGISLIIFAGIVANLPVALVQTLDQSRTGALSLALVLFLIIMAVAVIAFIVFVERAQRRLVVQYPKRQMGNKMFGGESSHLPLKLNTAGVIPPIFASSILLMPLTIAGFSGGATQGILGTIAAYLGPGQAL